MIVWDIVSGTAFGLVYFIFFLKPSLRCRIAGAANDSAYFCSWVSLLVSTSPYGIIYWFAILFGNFDWVSFAPSSLQLSFFISYFMLVVGLIFFIYSIGTRF